MDYNKLNNIQLDALKEVGNIGAAHAATALSQIIEQKIMISVSKVNIVPIRDIALVVGGDEKKAVTVGMKVLGDIFGGIILILAEKNALYLADILKNNSPGASREFSEMDISGLKEAGSILSNAYLTAIGEMIKMSLIPSVPELSLGKAGEILNHAFSELSRRSEIAFCIETEFIESSNMVKGHFLLIPEVKSLENILIALGLIKKE